MAQVTITKIVEGPSDIILKVDIYNNDGGGELSLYPVLSPGDVNPVPVKIVPGPAFRLMQAWFGLVWFDLTVYTGTLNPYPLWTMTRDGNDHVDFRSFGGILQLPQAAIIGETGVISLSTNGFNVLGSQGNMIFQFKKQNVVSG